MIKVYCRNGCSSSQKTLNWLQKYGIELKKKHVNQICREDIKKNTKRLLLWNGRDT